MRVGDLGPKAGLVRLASWIEPLFDVLAGVLPRVASLKLLIFIIPGQGYTAAVKMPMTVVGLLLFCLKCTGI